MITNQASCRLKQRRTKHDGASTIAQRGMAECKQVGDFGHSERPQMRESCAGPECWVFLFAAGGALFYVMA
ncbi:hypothetical protein SMC3_08130 [Candidatus Cryosericum hinesii]|uniref:Uncharacterized protein n=1 Tax=Candidatus Cryosericum hinesii TaxID=2290915 RepID=A0A398D9K7_9BACT|nr:hypothetical protein SMC3_08130 [Candidatus Cryosericum hinesii]